MFNLSNAVELMARIEIESLNGRWNQEEWGQLLADDSSEISLTEDHDLIVDSVTNLPVGWGTCGSGMCAAGWANTLAGNRMIWEEIGDLTFRAMDAKRSGDDKQERVPVLACEWLGIPWFPSKMDAEESGLGDLWYHEPVIGPLLFDTDNTIDMLYEQLGLWLTALSPTLVPSLSASAEQYIRDLVAERIPEMQKEAVARQT